MARSVFDSDGLLNVNMAFAANPLDRVSVERKDEAWVSRKMSDPDARVLLIWRGKVLFDASRNPEFQIAWQKMADLPEEIVGRSKVLLGLDDGEARIAIDLPGGDEWEDVGRWPNGDGFYELRRAAFRLPDGHLGILAQAKSLLEWHKRRAFCSNCGAKTVVLEGGYRRHCEECGADHFPRTDPVVIVGVTRGNRMALGRSARFPEKMYSVIAGFVEPGETIEEAVAREAKEEIGLDIGRVRYAGSQPWPFPSNLMMGCFAEALSDEIYLSDDELVEAHWFEREDLRKVIDSQTIQGGLIGDEESPFLLPPPQAIAHQLIRFWVENPEKFG